MTRRITYLVGPSCAGKTTTGKAVAAADPTVLWHDVDEHAIVRPRTAWLDWLHWQAAEGLHSATQAGRTHIVQTGIMWPANLIQSPAWRPAAKAGVKVTFLLLEWRWRDLRKRLDARLADKPASERRETIAYNRSLRRTLRSQVEAVRHGYVMLLDEDDPPEAVAEHVLEMVCD